MGLFLAICDFIESTFDDSERISTNYEQGIMEDKIIIRIRKF